MILILGLELVEKKAIRIKPDDAVELYYNDLIKAETYSNGLLAHFHLKVQGSQDQNAVIQMFADEGDILTISS